MQYQEIIENLLIKYSTEACEEQKQICTIHTNIEREYSDITKRSEYNQVFSDCDILDGEYVYKIDEDSIINSPLPDFI